MTFRKLAYKNVLGNWQQYIAFFLSSVFSVMIFYIFSAFIYHPDVINGKIASAAKVREGLVACQYIILVFSFFFVLYSIGAFLKSRKKEFGLLSMFGMTSGQLKRLVIYENLFISLLAIGAGIGLGALFSKLFFMALALLLEVSSPIAFAIPLKSVLVTGGWFFLLFQAITLLTLWKVGRSEIIELLHAARKPKTPPYSSPILVVISLLCLTAAYVMAYYVNGMIMIVLMLPILGLVMVGTYFLFTQLSIMLLGRMSKRKSLYYNRTNLVTISSLIFKMKDNSRVLFMVSIMCAVILTASATFYVFFESMKSEVRYSNPQTISYIERGVDAHSVFDRDVLKKLIADEGLEINYELNLVGLPSKQPNRWAPEKQTDGLIIAESAYNEQVARMKNVEPVHVEKDHGVFIYPTMGNEHFLDPQKPIEVTVGGETVKLQMDGERTIIIGPYYDVAGSMIVVDDDQYKVMSQKIADQDKNVLYGYAINNWTSIDPGFSEKLKGIAEPGQTYDYAVDRYRDMMQLSSLTMFIGLFISVLFFVASGAILYFKMFTELGEDQRLYAALSKIGMSRREISRSVTTQIAVLFFVPCVVGIMHTMFAMKSLDNVLPSSSAVLYSLIVIAIYLVMQAAYFFFARSSYMRKVMLTSNV